MRWLWVNQAAAPESFWNLHYLTLTEFCRRTFSLLLPNQGRHIKRTELHCGHFVELDLLQTYLPFFPRQGLRVTSFLPVPLPVIVILWLLSVTWFFFFNLLFSYYKVFYTLLFIMCPMLIEKLLWSSQSFAVGTRTFAPNVKKKRHTSLIRCSEHIHLIEFWYHFQMLSDAFWNVLEWSLISCVNVIFFFGACSLSSVSSLLWLVEPLFVSSVSRFCSLCCGLVLKKKNNKYPAKRTKCWFSPLGSVFDVFLTWWHQPASSLHPFFGLSFVSLVGSACVTARLSLCSPSFHCNIYCL